MKENSIEEDIKNAEHFIKSIKTDKEYKEENGWHGYYNKEIVELARILQHILSHYKRVFKEANRYKNMYKAEHEIHLVRNEQLDRKENAITRCKELENENKTIKEANNYWKSRYCEISNNSIPIQKVKNKIEEIGEKIKYEENEKVVIYLHKQKNILQELLESEESVMNEEEKKVVEDYKSKLDLYKYEKKIGLGRINIDEKIYEMEVIINVIERLQKENKKLKKSKITYERVRDIQEKNKNIVDKNYIPKKK